MDTQVHYIQAGWTVRSRDGHELGTVIELTSAAVVVSQDDQRRTVPKASIAEEDEGAKLAILSIDAEDLAADGPS